MIKMKLKNKNLLNKLKLIKNLNYIKFWGRKENKSRYEI